MINSTKEVIARIMLLLVVFAQACYTSFTLYTTIGWPFIIAALFGLFHWLMLSFFLFWFMDQLGPIMMGIYKKYFTYTVIEVSTTEASNWCNKNIHHYWVERDGIYYFLYSRDAMAFKLVWI